MFRKRTHGLSRQTNRPRKLLDLYITRLFETGGMLYFVLDYMITIDKEKNIFVLSGIEYPATQHNVNCYIKYKENGNEEELDKLSTVVLDI